MISRDSRTNDPLEAEHRVKYTALDFDEQRRLASQYLNRITYLQEEIALEEKKLLQLLRTYGLGIFSCS